MLAAGAHVLLTDKDGPALEEAWADLERQHPGRTWQVRCVVSSFADVERAVGVAVWRFGGVDIVVSNAGGAWTGALHTAAGVAALRASLEVNLIGHQNVARAASEVMLAQGQGGVLLFNASKSAFNQGPDFGPYAIPKAALLALMRQYAVDLAGHGARANAINADRVRTDLFKDGMLEARAKARGLPIDEYFPRQPPEARDHGPGRRRRVRLSRDRRRDDGLRRHRRRRQRRGLPTLGADDAEVRRDARRRGPERRGRRDLCMERAYRDCDAWRVRMRARPSRALARR